MVEFTRKVRDESMHYVLENEKKTVHKEGCTRIEKSVTVWHDLYLRMIGKGKYRVCPICCRADYKKILYDKNRAIIEKTKFAYIAVEGRSVFHRPSCACAASTAHLIGFENYKSALKKGRSPCKVCKPVNEELVGLELEKKEEKSLSVLGQIQEQEARKKQKRKHEQQEFFGLQKEEIRAIKRYRQAKAERQTCGVETKDARILTQTSFAFWAGVGYKNFHLRTCPSLDGMENLKGFSKYGHATRAGYTPCKHCKPSPKHNVVFSIPLKSKSVAGETVEELKQLCEKNQIPYAEEEAQFLLETAKGKWKIHLNRNPIRLEHINLAYQSREYHTQPKLFFSLRDTFYYILRHDQ